MRKTVCFPVRVRATGKSSDWGEDHIEKCGFRFTDRFLMKWFGGKRDFSYPREEVRFFTMQARV